MHHFVVFVYLPKRRRFKTTISMKKRFRLPHDLYIKKILLTKPGFLQQKVLGKSCETSEFCRRSSAGALLRGFHEIYGAITQQTTLHICITLYWASTQEHRASPPWYLPPPQFKQVELPLNWCLVWLFFSPPPPPPPPLRCFIWFPFLFRYLCRRFSFCPSFLLFSSPTLSGQPDILHFSTKKLSFPPWKKKPTPQSLLYLFCICEMFK